MALRISERSLVEGWIDCRVKGTVTGELSLCGWERPLTFTLDGLPHRDLAGCLLQFRNPSPHPNETVDSQQLASVHHGATGDITASRKVKVSTLTVNEMLSWAKAGLQVPYQWENGLYLEWFGSQGRVVLEATGLETETSEPVWHMTEAEEAQALREADDRLLGVLSAAVQSLDLSSTLDFSSDDDDEAREALG